MGQSEKNKYELVLVKGGDVNEKTMSIGLCTCEVSELYSNIIYITFKRIDIPDVATTISIFITDVLC